MFVNLIPVWVQLTKRFSSRPTSLVANKPLFSQLHDTFSTLSSSMHHMSGLNPNCCYSLVKLRSLTYVRTPQYSLQHPIFAYVRCGRTSRPHVCQRNYRIYTPYLFKCATIRAYEWSGNILQIPLLNLATGKELSIRPQARAALCRQFYGAHGSSSYFPCPYKRRVIECVDCFLNCIAILLWPRRT